MGEIRNTYTILIGNIEEKDYSEDLELYGKTNKMDLQVIWWVGTAFIRVKIGPGEGILPTW